MTRTPRRPSRHGQEPPGDLDTARGHIHKAPAGTAGPVVVPIGTPTNGATKGCASAARALIRDIRNNPSAYYVNVHNKDYPGGALRGQLR